MPLRSTGQALLPAVLLLSACGLAWAALYQVGQTAAARTRLTHAADAAAYSAALAQARALNLLAYVNRAQIAHQVAMAHMITLASWAQFSTTQAGRRAMGNPPAYLLGTLFGTQALRGYLAAQDTGGMAAGFAQQYAEHDALVHDTLRRAVDRQVAQLPAQRSAMLRAVLQANYPELAGRPDDLRMRWLDDTWPGFVQARPGSDAGMQALVRAAAARHDFLRPRDFTRRNAWIVQSRCPSRRHELRRRGATQLDSRGRWSASDTLSYHALRSNRWIGCYFREYATGWGLAGRHAAGAPIERAPDDFSNEDFWRWVEQNTSWDILTGNGNPLASAYASMSLVPAASRGLPAFHEAARADSTVRLAIAVRQSAASLPMAGAASALAFGARLAGPALGAADGLTVSAAAETFFSRPQPRDDGRDELATLFRPYWQARRVAVTEAEQRTARNTR